MTHALNAVQEASSYYSVNNYYLFATIYNIASAYNGIAARKYCI